MKLYLVGYDHSGYEGECTCFCPYRAYSSRKEAKRDPLLNESFLDARIQVWDTKTHEEIE